MHAVYEARNVICANIKRDDAISRRFIQYLAMQTNAVCLLVRDAKTSRILIEPLRDQQWLRREKLGLGRAVKKDWTVIQKIGEEFWKEVDSQRKWHFGFTDYYDIYVWDFEPGQPFGRLHSIVQEVSDFRMPLKNLRSSQARGMSHANLRIATSIKDRLRLLSATQ